MWVIAGLVIRQWKSQLKEDCTLDFGAKSERHTISQFDKSLIRIVLILVDRRVALDFEKWECWDLHRGIHSE